MIVVETSVWIAALGDGTSPVRAPLERWLEADRVWLAQPVRLDLLRRVRQGRPALAHALRGLPVLAPTDRTWRIVETIALAAADADVTCDVGHLLTAALADEHGVPVWSFQRTFARLADLGLVRLFDGLADANGPPAA